MFRSISLLFISAAIAHGGTPSTADVERWAAQLDAERFEIRQHAERRLLQAGKVAIDVLAKRVAAQDVEGSLRGLAVLRELAMQPNTRVSAAAESVIESLAENNVAATSFRAEAMLRSLRDMRSPRGLQILRQLGAKVRFDTESVEEKLLLQRVGGSVVFVVFDDAWIGSTEDLSFLSWLTDFRGFKVTFEGIRFTDRDLDAIKQNDRIVGVQLKRTAMTDVGLSYTQEMPSLRNVVVQYCDITPASFRFLDRDPPLDLVYVFGGKISKEEFDAFASMPKHKDNTMTRYGRGGFLGIGGVSYVSEDGSIHGCQVETLSPGKAAEKAGIRKGDVITKYNGRVVTTFIPVSRSVIRRAAPNDENEGPSLAELIGENLPGDRVSVTLLRGRDELEFEVELGDWP